jgi:predicted Zn-dependent protease with MMP-like domain
VIQIAGKTRGDPAPGEISSHSDTDFPDHAGENGYKGFVAVGLPCEDCRDVQPPGHRTLPATVDAESFEAAVDRVVQELPGWVRSALRNIEILVSDEPTPDLDPDGEGLLGLYIGIPLTERGANDGGNLPDVIHIFRQPHLSLGLPPDELEDEIRVTVMHEIAHYFGIDDDHLEDIGWG